MSFARTCLHWLLLTDAGLLVRISAGVTIFTGLAAADLRRNGPRATRWREYAVLFAAVLAALLYGAVNDQVTVTISPEYFLQGKELYKVVGDHPAEAALRWEAAKVGLKATWSVGLVFGVLLLLANNPWRGVPRLRNRTLVATLPLILGTAAVLGAVGGGLGYAGRLTWMDGDYFRPLVEADVLRPYRFMATWGVHLGGYVGGAVGTAAAVAVVAWKRAHSAERKAQT